MNKLNNYNMESHILLPLDVALVLSYGYYTYYINLANLFGKSATLLTQLSFGHELLVYPMYKFDDTAQGRGIC